MQTKNIGFIINSLAGGGAEKVVLKLAYGMAQQGHCVHFFLLENKIEYVIQPNYHIHTITDTGRAHPIKLLNNFYLAKKLKQKINDIENKNTKFDLFISTVPFSDLIANKLNLNNLYFRLTNTLSQEIKSLRKSKGLLKAWRRKSRYNKIYKNKNIIAVSNQCANDFLNQMHIKPKQIKTIYNPFDLTFIRKQADEINSAIPDNPFILFTGRDAKQKRLDILFKAFDIVRKHNPNLKLILLGEHKNYANPDVLTPGFQTNPYPWMKKATCSVLCSDREGFPSVLMESMICGTPVVSTDCPSGPSEILTDNLANHLVPMGNPELLAEKILLVLEKPEIIPENYFSKFKLNHITNQYLDLIN